MNIRAILVVVMVVVGGAPVVDAQLTQNDFDVVAFKWDTGETATNTPNGVLATPEPVLDGAVNLMIFSGTIPLYLDGPNNGGLVAFGFVDRTAWTPVNGDSYDLEDQFADVGDRVYALVTSGGGVELISEANFTSGVVVASTTVTLDPTKKWELVIDPVVDVATLTFGGSIVVQGNPFDGSSSAATRANISNDFVISVLCGGIDEDTGFATLNDMAPGTGLIFADDFESGDTSAWQ